MGPPAQRQLPDRSPRTGRSALAAVFSTPVVLLGLGVVLRVALLLAGAANIEPILDEAFYLGYGLEWLWFGEYTGDRAPGYPFVIRLAFGAFGPNAPLAVKLVQIAVSPIIGLCAMRLAARLHGARAQTAAGILWAFYLPLAAYTHHA